VITVGGFNTSVDKAIEIEDLRPGTVHRVRRMQAWPGGKGLHVALTAAALGESVRLVGLIDRAHRREFEDVLGARGVEFHGVETAGALRTCLALRDRGGARVTEILEAGPPTDEATREELRSRFLALARSSRIAVLSGSAPPGFDDDAYAGLVTALAEPPAPAQCLVDASGGLLRAAAEARPYLIKPNRDEAEALTGETVDGPAAGARVARTLAARGIGVVIVSLGAEGAVAASGTHVVHASVSVPEAAHPVGSGDCLLGGVAVGLDRGLELDEVLRLGVACGAANTVSPETGWVRRADVDALRPRVRTTVLA
jgi:1-phosphofructokinase family hexose kinase